jgi:hypothetical protein
MHSDNERYEIFIIDLMRRLSKDLAADSWGMLDKSFHHYQNIKGEDATFDMWCEGALKEMLDLGALKQGFLAFLSNGNIDSFASENSCLPYLRPGFQKYSLPLSECFQQSLESLGMQESGYVFRRNGKSWEIVFDGMQVVFDGEYKGLAYIQFLLKNPGKPVSASSLMANASNPEVAKTFSVSENEMLAGSRIGLKRTALVDLIGNENKYENMREKPAYDAMEKTQKYLDEIGQKGVNALLSSLTEELESCSDQSRRDEIVSLIPSINKALNGKFLTNGDKKRLAVLKCIKKVKEVAATKYPEFTEFLNNYISTGANCKYTSPSNKTISWKF